jgi:hypothetical protein
MILATCDPGSCPHGGAVGKVRDMGYGANEIMGFQTGE